MSTDVLVLLSNRVDTTSESVTVGCTHNEVAQTEEQLHQQLLDECIQHPQFYVTGEQYFATADHFGSAHMRVTDRRSLDCWDEILSEIQSQAVRYISTVWDSPKLKRLLSEPIGAPIELTREEAEEIVRLAAGRRSDLPVGTEFVRDVRENIGHSLIDRAQKSDQR